MSEQHVSIFTVVENQVKETLNKSDNLKNLIERLQNLMEKMDEFDGYKKNYSLSLAKPSNASFNYSTVEDTVIAREGIYRLVSAVNDELDAIPAVYGVKYFIQLNFVTGNVIMK